MDSDAPPTAQTVLEAFDYETTLDEPWLTVPAVAEAIREHFNPRVTEREVRTRLHEMQHANTVEHHGGWWRSLVAPRLADDVRQEVDDDTELVPLEDMENDKTQSHEDLFDDVGEE
ncbi:helix-turn-helix domain-containing protein [Haloarcula sp. JP-L23]|uniref:helix-turn-helix domain-containing protein n=1 Tax=Haloarcula sp. JP-L23 TaxID=2716717 RepID=UPI00140EEA1F|nr:helix-turn-helix domain-containing protein [Haloarcula sp. JP-L23]